MCANTAVNSFVLKGHTSFDVFIIITLCCRSAGAANMHKSWTHDECKAAIHQHKYYERTEPNKSAVCRRTNARLQDAMNNVDCFCFYFSIWCFFYFKFFFFFSLWRLILMNSVFFVKFLVGINTKCYIHWYAWYVRFYFLLLFILPWKRRIIIWLFCCMHSEIHSNSL